jgi:Ca2+-binding RTX toxin-like protein
MIGGLGNDTLTAGAGSDTMTGGQGDNVFTFVRGAFGRHDFITDFGRKESSDALNLQGYGAPAPVLVNALATATLSNGAITIALPDNTRITFEGASSVTSLNIKLT